MEISSRRFVIANLTSVDLLGEIQSKAELLDECRLVRLGPNQTLFEQGEVALNAFVPISGHLKIAAKTAGHERTLAILAPGEPGGVLLLDHQNDGFYPGSVVAMDQAVVLLIPKKQYLEVWDKNLRLKSWINQCVRQRLKSIHEERVLYNSRIESKLAKFFLNHLVEKKDLLNKRMTRRQIALAVGAKTETVIRAIRRLENSGIISTQESVFTILNEDELKNLMES